MVNNYPDDIRQHDDNPNSPFYDDSRAVWIESTAEEIKNELLSIDGYRVNGATYGMGDILEKIAGSEELTEEFQYLLSEPMITNNRMELNNFLSGVAFVFGRELAADELAAKENDCDNK